jgi:hypothetical protein
MFLTWVLIALPLVSMLYFAWVIAWQKPAAHIASQTCWSLASNLDPRTFPRSKRTIKWISSGEFESIIGRFQDVIFIDLLPNTCEGLRPFRGAHLLFVQPEELGDVLRWAPPSSCVVLHGPPDLCKQMISAARKITGHAPVFVLAVKA